MPADNTPVDNYKMFTYFFSALILSCCIVMFFPAITNNPNNILFCYFFIAFSLVSLFVTCYFNPLINQDDNYLTTYLTYISPAFLFIFITVFYCFIIILKNKEIIQKGNVNDFYYKFNTITVVLIILECFFLNRLYDLFETNKKSNGSQKNVVLYNIIVLAVCSLNIFIMASNSIGLSHFSADG